MSTAKAELLEAPKFEYQIQSASKEEDYAALLDIIVQARAKLADGV